MQKSCKDLEAFHSDKNKTPTFSRPKNMKPRSPRKSTLEQRNVMFPSAYKKTLKAALYKLYLKHDQKFTWNCKLHKFNSV